MMNIKQVGNRYYYFSTMQMRSFPIKKVEALAKIESGEAELVERFITDLSYDDVMKEETEVLETITVEQVEETPVKLNKVSSDKVVNFSDRFQAKKEEQDLENAKNHFLNEILPNLKMDEMKHMLDIATNDKEKFAEMMMKAALRISVEKSINDLKGGTN